nr:unnamed protein product [Callosobruchus analis]
MNEYNPISVGISTFVDLPPFIRSSKSVINIKNNDPYCFLWSVVCALYPAPEDKNVSRVSSYPHFSKILKFGNIKFPIKLKDIPNFEQLNGLAINVFTVVVKEVAHLQVEIQQNFITTSKHNVYTASQKKVALSPYDDKRMEEPPAKKPKKRIIPSTVNTDTPQDPVGIWSTIPKELLGEYIRGTIHTGQCKTFFCFCEESLRRNTTTTRLIPPEELFKSPINLFCYSSHGEDKLDSSES